MNKKTIAIAIAIVVAVAAWLLWRHKKQNEATTETTTDEPLTGLEAVIKASQMTKADARDVRRFAREVESSMTDKATIEQKALDNGYTYNQQLALDALWVKYFDAEGKLIHDADSPYVFAVVERIQNYVN